MTWKTIARDQNGDIWMYNVPKEDLELVDGVWKFKTPNLHSDLEFDPITEIISPGEALSI